MDVEVRAWVPDDAAALNEAVERSRDHMRPWLAWASEPRMTIAERQAWFEEMRGSLIHELYGVFSRGEIVGSVGLHRRIGPRAAEVGYWVHVDHTRRGIATAAVRQICQLAFADGRTDHVEIHHDRANVASGRVAQAAGFTHLLDRPDPKIGPADEGIESVWSLRSPRRPPASAPPSLDARNPDGRPASRHPATGPAQHRSS